MSDSPSPQTPPRPPRLQPPSYRLQRLTSALWFPLFLTVFAVITGHDGTFGLLSGLVAAAIFLSLGRRRATSPLDDDRFPLRRLAILARRTVETSEAPLHRVIFDTEQSATEIMGRVKNLDRTATQLLTYLKTADEETAELQNQIQEGTEVIERIGEFIRDLPERMEKEHRDALVLVEQINDIMQMSSKMGEAIKQISQKTGIVAINAAIQAAHAGEQGRSFTVVSDEVRHLATQSSGAADQITQAVRSIHSTVENYLHDRVDRDFSKDLEEATHIAESVRKLRSDYEDMKQYYKTLFLVVRNYNAELADAILETLGTIQYQDVVRQRLERVIDLQRELRQLLERGVEDGHTLRSEQWFTDLDQKLKDYSEAENRHGDWATTSGTNPSTTGVDASAAPAQATEAAPAKIELF